MLQTCTIHWQKGEKENEEAGFILLEKMKQREHPIPVIICSSQNYRSPDALGTVWYNKLRDIEFDFKEILENTNWDHFRDESRKRREGETHDLCDV